MRYVFTLAALATFAFLGCNTSEEGGAPNTSNSFTLSGPANTLPTTIKQDTSEMVKLTLNRGKNFRQKVHLAVTSPTDKVKAELSKNEVAPSDPAEVNLKVTAAKDAPLGEHVLRVTATPEGGTATAIDVKIKLEAP
ncbi:MAG: hypothetical protein U0792_02810 [Gemmataceae bacterium]